MSIALNYLEKFQPAYFTRLQAAVKMAKEAGLSSSAMECAASKFNVSFSDISMLAE